MQVALIEYTGRGAGPRAAAELLAFTKATRLNMTPALMDEIRSWSQEALDAELTYMAHTIPSSWEFCDYVFLLGGVSRAFTHQLVRTRAASYAQQTLRVLDLSDGFDYVYTDRNAEDAAAMTIINVTLDVIRNAYASLVAIGQPPEDARGILPTNIATNIAVKVNLRTLAELAASRTGGRTQGEYRKVMNAMADAVLAVHPWAEQFLFNRGRDYFAELEAAIAAEFPNDLLKRGKFLKIVDAMRKERA